MIEITTIILINYMSVVPAANTHINITYIKYDQVCNLYNYLNYINYFITQCLMLKAPFLIVNCSL